MPQQKIHNLLVIGTGKVGKLVALLLSQGGFAVTTLDQKPQKSKYFKSITGDVTRKETIIRALKGKDAVVTCLPYHLNLTVAEAAFAAGVHYFDLTEDVATTQAIRHMNKRAKGVMAP